MAKRRTKGDGAIYFDEKRGLFVGQISIGTDESGKRKRKTVYGKTKAEAHQKLKAVEIGIYTGTFVDTSNITLYQLAKQMLDDKLNTNEIKEATYWRNNETLKVLAPIYNTPLQKMNETQLRNFFNGIICAYSQSVIDKVYALAARTFKEAVRRGIASENPIEYLTKPRSKKTTERVRALTKDEQRALMKVLTEEDIPYSRQMLLSLSLGLRMGEINALHVEDVNFAFNRVTVHRTISKGKKGEAILSDTTKTVNGMRTLTMTSSVCALLRDCIGAKKSGLIFKHNNKLITTSQVNSQFIRIRNKYDIVDNAITDGKIDLHSLRHTFGTRCAEAGMPPKVLQEIMGHSDIRITMNTYFYATSDYIGDNLARIDSILCDEGLTVSENWGQIAL